MVSNTYFLYEFHGLWYNDWNSGLSDEKIRQNIQHYVERGMTQQEAEEYCNRNIEIADYLNENPSAGYTFAKGQMISYGRKKGPAN